MCDINRHDNLIDERGDIVTLSIYGDERSAIVMIKRNGRTESPAIWNDERKYYVWESKKFYSYYDLRFAVTGIDERLTARYA